MQGKCLLPWFQSQSRWVFFALHDLDAALARRPESAGLDAFTICAVKFRGPAMCCDHKEVPNGVSKCTAAMIKEVPCIKPACPAAETATLTMQKNAPRRTSDLQPNRESDAPVVDNLRPTISFD